MTIYAEKIQQQDPRLRRHIVHDSRSLAFPLEQVVDKSTWHTKSIRVYDPRPNPNQTVGNCTCCSKASQLNAVGNRRRGVVLDMKWAMNAYHVETGLDPFPGQYPGQDTGSNGLSSCKTAQLLGVGGPYRWIFNGADGIVQAIMSGLTPSVGTRWTEGMFNRDSDLVIRPTGADAGGHQYVYNRYDKARDLLGGLCWWGDDWRNFWIKRGAANELVMDKGDSHVQARA